MPFEVEFILPMYLMVTFGIHTDANITRNFTFHIYIGFVDKL